MPLHATESQALELPHEQCGAPDLKGHLAVQQAARPDDSGATGAWPSPVKADFSFLRTKPIRFTVPFKALADRPWPISLASPHCPRGSCGRLSFFLLLRLPDWSRCCLRVLLYVFSQMPLGEIDLKESEQHAQPPSSSLITQLLWPDCLLVPC